jgi:hypothetical protein
MLKFIDMRLVGHLSHMEERSHACEVWAGKRNKNIQEMMEGYYWSTLEGMYKIVSLWYEFVVLWKCTNSGQFSMR